MNKIKIFAFLVLALFLFQTTAFGWGDPGHMAVAQIAFNNLNSSAKKDRANELAALIEMNDRDYEFVTSACWMDDIRDLAMFEPLKDWHFITQMHIVNNAVPRENPPPVNIVEVIKFLSKKLRGRDSDLKKAYYLAELVHLVGDIHQPLHGATRFTPSDPDGDLGGNSFTLSEEAPRPNLHSYWDAGGGLFRFQNLNRPLTDNRRARLNSFVTSITNDFPRNQATGAFNNLDPQVWANESFNFAVSDVYVGVTENSVPNTDYEAKAKKLSARRIALAGYRLAGLLNNANF